MLNGSFHGLTESEILAWLLDHPRPEDRPDAGGDETAAGAEREDRVESVDIAQTAPDSVTSSAERWALEHIATREGVEIRVGLATLIGWDERPAEIAGLGAVGADLARRAVLAQLRGAAWQFAIVGTDGHLLLAGPLRRRPRQHGGVTASRVRGGVVELHLTAAELERFVADPRTTASWAEVVAEIAAGWAARHHLQEQLARHPDARFARGALARHVHIRDRTCCGPGCTRSARRSDLDHTRDHSRGGATVAANIGPGRHRHHPDKDRGWTLTQPESGHFVWRSPLGRTYRTRGEPVRPDLPDPEAPSPGSDQRKAPETDDAGHLGPRILWKRARNPARPPPAPSSRCDEEPPF
jgi:hypothetical protein